MSVLCDNIDMESKEREVIYLVTDDGKSPLGDWLAGIRDKPTRRRIEMRIERARLGNFGVWRELAEGVFEMKIDFGPGYRVYYGIHNDQIVVLIAGGDKSTQDRDIERAIALWKEYKNANERL